MSNQFCPKSNPKCREYGLSNEVSGGNVFLQALNNAVNNASAVGQLPPNGSDASLNTKYWKTLSTDRNMEAAYSNVSNTGSFFNVKTFSDIPSNDTESISGNDIYNAITEAKPPMAIDDFGNLSIGRKLWKNPLTPGKITEEPPRIVINSLKNKNMILNQNGKWMLVRDLGISDKKVYYMLFNPIHSGERKDDPTSVGTPSFRKWYNSQIDPVTNGPRITGAKDRRNDAILHKYCEITAEKTDGRTITDEKQSFINPVDDDSGGMPYVAGNDGERNYADNACFYLQPKEGVFKRAGMVFDPQQAESADLYGQAQESLLCSDPLSNYMFEKRSQSFIGDFINDYKQRLFSSGTNKEPNCPARSINICSVVQNAAGNLNIKESKIENNCGGRPARPKPTFPPEPIPTTPAPTTPAPTTPAPTTPAPTTPAPTTPAPTTPAPTTPAPTTPAPTTPAPTTPAPTTPAPTTPAPTTPAPTKAPVASSSMPLIIGGVACVIGLVVYMKFIKK